MNFRTYKLETVLMKCRHLEFLITYIKIKSYIYLFILTWNDGIILSNTFIFSPGEGGIEWVWFSISKLIPLTVCYFREYDKFYEFKYSMFLVQFNLFILK
jgi:hypothetical protein